MHTPVAGFCSRLAARGLRAGGLQVVYTAHGFHFHPQGNAVSNGIYRFLERIAGRWTDELVVINRHDEREALAHQIVPADRITFTPGIGIDTLEWSAERVDAGAVQAVASELRIAAGTPLGLMVAEFNPGKRHADALRAFAAMRARNAHLLFAGTGPQWKAMQELSASLGVGERVHFLGMRRDIPVLMAAAAFLVLPSEREGLPRSILEAMALGRCVIGTDIRGIRDLLEPDRGVLVPLGDWQALAAAMDGVLADPVHTQRLGRHARAAAVDCYDTRRILEQHAVLYDRCLRRRGFGTMRRSAAL